jgi:two-component system chemotaxis response regulator CheY
MRVLIVDDSRAMRMIVARALRQAGFDGLELVEAANGAEALTCIQQEQPDLVLSDWNMPEVNGLELLTRLRSSRNTVPFGFVTSESTPEMTRLAEGAGAMFMIKKPFTPEVFRGTIGPAVC